LYGDGDVFLASKRLAEGLAFVYRGVLEASARHLETRGEAGVDELEQGLRQSRLGDEFPQTVSKNREALVDNPQLRVAIGVSGGLVAPAVAAPLKPPQEFVPECSITAFSLQCGHGKRGYVLDAMGDGGGKILRVVTAEVSIRESENGNGRKHGRTDDNTGKESTSEKTYTRREEKSGSYELLKPCTWPEWKDENDKKKGVEIGKLDI
jgi:hypothetical protein